MNTDLYIGPLIEYSGKFAYDTFCEKVGRRSSFRYPRIEQARHDQRVKLAELKSDRGARIHVCETLDEFEGQIAAAHRPDPWGRTQKSM